MQENGTENDWRKGGLVRGLVYVLRLNGDMLVSLTAVGSSLGLAAALAGAIGA